jgi:hypothetical protein
MKFTQLLWLAIGCTALVPVASYAASSQQASGEKQQKERTPDEERTVGGASNRTHSLSRARITAARPPKQLANGQKHSIPGKAANLHASPSDKAGGLATGGLIQNDGVNNAQRVRPTTLTRPNVASLNPLPNNMRHRGPNPAVVGGSANSNRINAGAINGTNMHRRP